MTIPEAIKVGDYVHFGNYPQGADGDIRPVEWQLLAKKGNRILLISRYGLEARRFDISSNNWKNSEIRKWLNDEFYNRAFSENEKKLIRYTKKEVGFWESLFGQSDLTKLIDGDIFLLSDEELYKYFPYNSFSRKCKATEYAVKNGANVADNGYSWWWLRSSFPVGMYGVYGITADGNYFNYAIGSCIGIVRPALWINL
ncbi:hypothetical protein IJJ97_05725 [bacterium]|nr:hypothetical protein [bacterium]